MEIFSKLNIKEEVKYAICRNEETGTYHAFFMKNTNDIRFNSENSPICSHPDLVNMTLEDWHNDWEIYKRDITGNETRNILADLRNNGEDICGKCCSVIFGNNNLELKELLKRTINRIS